MSNDAYHRQAAWAALLGVTFLVVVALVLWPQARWGFGGLLAVWAVGRCVRIRRA